jgi:cbb3-type cytochrome oxidase subunit 3
MNLPTAAVVFVALAFTALVVWVLLPRNRSRLEAHGAIPLEGDDSQQERNRRSR